MTSRTIVKAAPVRRGATSARVQVAEMQRSRLLSAAVVTVEELGWSGASVAHITSRARVSRRTFYDLFGNREDCLLAVFEEIVGRIEGELRALDLDGLSWRERVRTGLWTILCFLDREPLLARLCITRTLQGGPRVFARREEILARLAAVLDEGRHDSDKARACPPLTAEGLVGAVFSIVHARLMRDDHQPLIGLLGELMGMIVLPYLGPAVARRERDRSTPPRPAPNGSGASGAPTEQDPLLGVPMRLTYRTARVLATIAECPGISNRVVGELAGVPDQGQISKLLARLERLGLTAKTGDGHSKGESNAWSLTPLGLQVARRVDPSDRDLEGAV